jgi:hypothetical protein
MTFCWALFPFSGGRRGGAAFSPLPMFTFIQSKWHEKNKKVGWMYKMKGRKDPPQVYILVL